ncbi:MAG: M56 family metallopeptidase [Bacteroidota bacterium]
MNWSLYLLQTSLIWLLGYLFLQWWLKGEKLPSAKRWLLLAFLIGAPLLSLLPLPSWASQWRIIPPIGIGHGLPTDSLLLPGIEVSELGLQKGLTALSWWWYLWATGALIMFSRLLYGWWQIQRLYSRSERGSLLGRRVSLLRQLNSPFSYGPLLFWPKAINPQAKDWQAIWQHELAHIDQRHSLDVLLTDLLLLAFWWNPLVWLYRRSLRLQHEVLADAAAGSHTDIQHYTRQLISPQFMSATPLASHSFHHSFIKTRIEMLHRPQGARWKLAALFPLLLLTFWACSQLAVEADELVPESEVMHASLSRFQPILETDTIITFDPETFEESTHIVSSEYYTEVEQFPVFGDCPPLEAEALKECSFQNILVGVYSNIRYPQSAQSLGLDGQTLVSFRLSDTGELSYFTLERSSMSSRSAELPLPTDEELIAYSDLDRAALAAVRSLNGNWTAARINGEAVSMQLLLPINFKLEE